MRLDRNDSLRFAKRRVFGLNRQALKSAGAWMNNMAGSGAKSLLHRRKVGGGNLVAESKCALRLGRILVKLHAFRRIRRTLDQEAPHPALSPWRGNSFSFCFPRVPLSSLLPSSFRRISSFSPSPGGEGRVRGLFLGIGEKLSNEAKPVPGNRHPLVHPRNLRLLPRSCASILLDTSATLCGT